MPSDAIEGTWLPLKAEFSGEQAPDMALSAMCLILRAGTYEVQYGKDASDSGSYALHSSTEPHTITLKSECGTNKGRTIPSIYQLVGDRLRICFGLDGTLPSSFAAPAGSGLYLVSYRRKA